MRTLSEHITEALNEKLSDVKVEGGKMHELLGIPEGETIKDNYTDPVKLAQDLYDKVGDKKEVAGMLAYVANINSEEDIYDKALASLDEIVEK